MTATLQPAVVEVERRSKVLLPHVSRTFALGIRLLPARLERPVRVGYLLCRIADTVEDDVTLPPERKAALLDAFLACFDDTRCADAYDAVADEVRGDPHHRELVGMTGGVFVAYRSLDDRSRAILHEWVGEMVAGMKQFVVEHPAGIRIGTIAEFRRYCYYVAGTVGHLLTDLWHAHSSAVGPTAYARLLPDCEAFGEALQTVNILKDVATDVERENAIYVPADLLAAAGSAQEAILDGAHRAANRIALEGLIELARDDVRRALDYTCGLPYGAPRVRLFCALPLLFAIATLRELERSEAMLTPGGTVKISREEVKAIIAASSVAALTNASLRALAGRIARKPFLRA